jgi:protease-4
MIQRGESQGGPIGSAVMGAESVSRAFREAIEDDDVRAILFRVDSPGGSYVASDVIWRETERARAAGKPVVASMGSTAASGGYFVSMAANRIVAHPSTVTGSIGVYGGKMLVEGLAEKAGVAWDDVRVGGNATMWSVVEPYSPEEWAHLQTALDRIYEDFTAKAARGRGLSRDSVHALARGRIWTGADAHRVGLVDDLGGFDVALAAAKEEAELAADVDVEVRLFPRPRSLLEMVLAPRRESGYSTELRPLAQALELFEPLISEMARLLGGSESGALLMPYFRPPE